MTTTEFAHHARHSTVYRPRAARHGDRSSREHESSKNLPAGSNPSKRHLADRGIIVPSDKPTKWIVLSRPTDIGGSAVRSLSAKGDGHKA